VVLNGKGKFLKQDYHGEVDMSVVVGVYGTPVNKNGSSLCANNVRRRNVVGPDGRRLAVREATFYWGPDNKAILLGDGGLVCRNGDAVRRRKDGRAVDSTGNLLPGLQTAACLQCPGKNCPWDGTGG
jgi:hypothetical protein